MNKPYSSGGSWSNHGGRSKRFVQEINHQGASGNEFFRRGHDSRFTPYAGGGGRRNQNKRRNQRGANRNGPPSRANENQWYKIMIPYGKKSGKDFILKSIAGLCKTPFVPVNFQFVGNAAVFFVSDYVSAIAIKEVSRKITAPNGYKINIIMTRSPPPQTLLDAEVSEFIKTVMSDRYNVQTKQLNMSNFQEDPALKASGVYAPLQRKNVFDACVKIIKEHIPDLQSLHLGNNKIVMLEPLSSLVTTCKSLRSINLGNNKLVAMNELNNIKGMVIEELVLDGNPLCDNYKDQATYISAVRDRLPKVVRLDGETLPTPIGFDLGTEEELPPVNGSFFPNEEVKQMIVKFLETYFCIYDSDNRQPLLAAYHDQAVFSMSVSKLNRGGQFQDYGIESRNLIHVHDNSLKVKLLNQGKLNIVSTLSRLPATQHDPTSMMVDVSYFDTLLMTFTVMGVFKEPPQKDREVLPLRTFSRNFIVVPNGQDGFVILNETLVVTNATVEQIKAHKIALSGTPSASQTPVAPTPMSGPSAEEKSRLALELANLTGMNIDYSVKCLDENNWNLQSATNLFRELQSLGAIPAEAFQK